MRRLKWVTTVMVCAGGAFTRAGTILDYSPGSNTATIDAALNGAGQHFFEPVMFPSGATVTGIAIYTNPTIASVTSADIEIDADASGVPGTALSFEVEPVTQDSVGTRPGNDARAFASLASPFTMAPGQTYWFSMEGHFGNLNCYLYDQSDNPFGGKVYQVNASGGGERIPADVAMQLYGTVAPEPATLSLLTIVPLLLTGRRAARHRKMQ
jgi:hypothetical protein